MKGSQIKNLNQTGRYVSFNVCVCVFVCVNQCVDTIHVFFFVFNYYLFRKINQNSKTSIPRMSEIFY